MKSIKALIVAIFFLAVPAAMLGQFRYGPVAGVNFNTLKFKQDLVDISSTIGAQAGVQAELMFPGIGFGIDFGLLYNMEGANVDLGSRKIWNSDGFKKTDVTLHMIQIPFHLRFKWTRMNGLEDYIAPFVYGGPDFSFMVAHNSIKGNAGVPNPFRYAGGDLGLTAGGGFELYKLWQVSVQYTWGMTYLLKTRKLENYSAQNRQLAVRVAYLF